MTSKRIRAADSARTTIRKLDHTADELTQYLARDALWAWEVGPHETVLAERIEMIGMGHKHIRSV